MALLAVKEERASNIQKAEHGTWSGEAMAFCPLCKALQAIWINDDTLMPTRTFRHKIRPNTIVAQASRTDCTIAGDDRFSQRDL